MEIKIINILKFLYKKFLNFCQKYNIFIIIFLCAFFVQYFLVLSTSSLKEDEICTFSILTSSNQFEGLYKENYYIFNAPNGHVYKISDVQKTIYSPRKGISALLDDLRIIRTQRMDPSHPSLYYSLLRIYSSCLNDFDGYKYLTHARSLNLIFFTIAFFYMYKLLSYINRDKKFISFGLIFAFFPNGVISLSFLAREYEIQSMFFVIVTYAL